MTTLNITKETKVKFPMINRETCGIEAGDHVQVITQTGEEVRGVSIGIKFDTQLVQIKAIKIDDCGSIVYVNNPSRVSVIQRWEE